MAGILIEVAGHIMAGKTRVSKYIESEYGFYRTCVSEIAKDGMARKVYADAHSPTIYGCAAMQAELEAQAMLEAGKNVVLEVFSGSMDLVKRMDAIHAKKFLLVLHADARILVERYLEAGKARFKDWHAEGIQGLRKKLTKEFQAEYSLPELASTEVLNYKNDHESDFLTMIRGIDCRLDGLCRKVPESRRIPNREVISLGMLFMQHDLPIYLSQFLPKKKKSK